MRTMETTNTNREGETMTATPAKLRDGSWGARVPGSVQAGDVVTITTRGGKSWDATISMVIWSNDEISICATGSAPSRRAPAPRSQSRRTGCSCGSREDQYGDLVPSPRNCRCCEHDG